MDSIFLRSFKTGRIYISTIGDDKDSTNAKKPFVDSPITKKQRTKQVKCTKQGCKMKYSIQE